MSVLPVTPLSPLVVVSDVLALVESALVACGTSDLNRVFVAAGLVAWDDCCGTLYAAPERVYRAATFPIEGPDANGCFEGLIVMNMVVTLLRCVPVVDNRGRPPTISAMESAYTTLVREAAIIWNALTPSLPNDWEHTGLNQTFVGADGGCIGVETRLTVGLGCETWSACPVP